MDTSISLSSFLKMEERVSFKIMRGLALVALWIALLLIVVGLLLCFFAKDEIQIMGLGFVAYGIGGIISAFLFNGFVIVVKAAALYIEKANAEDDKTDSAEE